LYKLTLFFCLYFVSFINCQTKKDRACELKKVGILFSSAKQNSFLIFDNDYDYKVHAFKFQFFYSVRRGKKWDFNFLVQPQFQMATHQLLNTYFITPDTPNFEFLRTKFSKKKNLSLYAFELGFQLRRNISKKIFFEATLGLGIAYIDLSSERLAQGFTFIENLSLGMSYEFHQSELYLGSTIGHVSNLDFKLPNDGYNSFGFELGYRIYIN